MSRRVVITADHKMRDAVLRDAYTGKETGTVYYSECTLCGFVRWISSNGAEPTGYLVAEFRDGSPNECERCNEAFHRTPEVARWVHGVANKIYGDLMKKIDETKPTT